jgi:hypothetical protein
VGGGVIVVNESDQVGGCREFGEFLAVESRAGCNKDYENVAAVWNSVATLSGDPFELVTSSRRQQIVFERRKEYVVEWLTIQLDDAGCIVATDLTFERLR